MRRLRLGGIGLLLLCSACSVEWLDNPRPDGGAACHGKCDTPAVPSGSVGRCIPFVPFPGYQTCLMSAPQHASAASGTGPTTVLFSNLPPKVDRSILKGCIEVHSQGSCGWCTAHATTAALEAMLCQSKQPYRRISEPHLWWLGKDRGPFSDCKGGWYISSAFTNLGTMTDQGYLLVRDTLWPYVDDVAQMNATKPTNAELKQQGEHGCPSAQIGTVASKSVIALKTALAAGYNVVYSVATFRDVGWKWWDADHGAIVAPKPAPPGLCKCDDCPDEEHCLTGYHAILVVGYDDANGGRFDFLNSWGPWWGFSGFGTISYDTIGQYGYGGRYPKQLKVVPLAPPGPDAAPPDLPPPDSQAPLPDGPVADAPAAEAAAADAGTPDGCTADGPDAAGAADAAPLDNSGTCAGATPLALAASPLTVSGDTSGAANEFGAAIACGTGLTFDGPQRYYRLALAAGTTYTITLKPTGFDAALYLFGDTSCQPGSIETQCTGQVADTGRAGGQEQLVITPQATQDYVCAVDSFDPAAAGPFTLTVSW